VELARDLGSADLWADSLERSLARRGRPRRASLELGRLNPARDLADEGTVNESAVYWRARRAASSGSAFTGPAVGGASVLALLAATTLPSLAGGARAAGGTRSEHHSAKGTSGHATAPAHAVVHRAAAAKRGVFTAVVAAPAQSAAATVVETDAVLTPKQIVYGRVTFGDVRDAQRLLGVPVDGSLGPKTGAAIRAFQASHGLAVDGDVGRLTWDALAAAEHASERAAAAAADTPAATTPAQSSAPVVREDAVLQQATPSDSAAVIALQQALGITTDGTFGPATVATVEAFQSAHGLTPDGVVGPDTRVALGLGAGPTLQATVSDGGTGGPALATTDATDTTDTTTGTTAAPTETDTAGATTTDTAGATTATTVSAPATTTSSTPADVETALSEMIAAANQIATLPYIWGGGHGSWVSPGYDCSGSVSYVLHAAGLLSSPEDSTALESYGAPGPGQYITIYADVGHAWMTIEGQRFDTVALSEDGSRWADGGGEFAGYVVRHPVGF
jgi:peptidoglycan hydrolase-like protein with peptidoglycan-binding domain